MASNTGPSPYGTRSRQRSTAQRINYAEDKDNDMDFEYTNNSSTSSNTRSSNAHAANAPDTAAVAATANSSSTPSNTTITAVGMSTRSHGPAPAASSAGTTTTSRRSSTVANLTQSTVPPPPPSAPAPTTTNAPANSRKRKSTAAAPPPVTTSSSSSSTTAPLANGTSTRPAVRTHDRARERQKMRDALTHQLTFEKYGGAFMTKGSYLEADDGTRLAVNDHIYLISEPPGEPYYIGRIMKFGHVNGKSTGLVDSITVNWYYRPKDIGSRKTADSRLLFATMHSDGCPLSSIRGKCTILHRSEIKDLEAYKKQKDCFYFERLYDRYLQRYLDIIPVAQVRNVPDKVKDVLNELWRFVLIEQGKSGLLTAEMRSCKKCRDFCANDNSVVCAMCEESFHFQCVNPPLTKKPQRGFGWSCAPCSRAHERKLDARNGTHFDLPVDHADDALEENHHEEEEDEEHRPNASGATTGNGANTPATPRSWELDPAAHKHVMDTLAQWPYRYLGINCKPEEVLEMDDRIFPRGGMSIGQKHQAIVAPWYGRPVELIAPAEEKVREGGRGPRGKGKRARRDLDDARSAANRPPWVQEAPEGYVERGVSDDTSEPMFIMPDEDDEERGIERTSTRRMSRARPHGPDMENVVDEFMLKAENVAKHCGVAKNATNFLDKAIQLLYANNFDQKAALDQLKQNDKKSLKEPDFKPDEAKRFEEGVKKFGSELWSVNKHVKTKKHGDIVRHYYMWKKTPRGQEIWGNYEGRKAKKEAKQRDKADAAAAAKLADDVADVDDDSAFDDEKALGRNKQFQCKFCGTQKSVQWRRAPGVTPGETISPKTNKKDAEKYTFIPALCRRCGELWRRYAVPWENPDDVFKKPGVGANRNIRRKIDEELIREITAADEDAKSVEEYLRVQGIYPPAITPIPEKEVIAVVTPTASEPPKKKPKTTDVQEPPAPTVVSSTKESVPTPTNKKKKAPPPPPPEPPKPKLLPCAVCDLVEPVGSEHLVCRDCRLTVHRACYGVGVVRSANKWVCDMCANDKNPLVSTEYICVLCPVRGDGEAEEEQARLRAAERPYPNSSRSAKDKEAREKERERLKELEKEKALAETNGDSPPTASEREEANKKRDVVDKTRPANPRQPLKRTVGNNWVHIRCGVWTGEIRFGDWKTLSPAEGIGTIPPQKFQAECSICWDPKVPDKKKGACVQCHYCHTHFHVGCAHKAGYRFGFDIQPVKSSRRDTVNIVSIGNETGNMQAMIWCPSHEPKTQYHEMTEMVPDTSYNALQLYLEHYKQADLTLTGTVRKAQLVTLSTKASQQTGRRSSLISAGSGHGHRNSISSPINAHHEPTSPTSTHPENARRCRKCRVDVSPLWHEFKILMKKEPVAIDVPDIGEPRSELANGVHSADDMDTSEDFVADSTPPPTEIVEYVCHKCHWDELHPPKVTAEPPVEKPRSRNPLSISGLIDPPSRQSPPPRDLREIQRELVREIPRDIPRRELSNEVPRDMQRDIQRELTRDITHPIVRPPSRELPHELPYGEPVPVAYQPAPPPPPPPPPPAHPPLEQASVQVYAPPPNHMVNPPYEPPRQSPYYTPPPHVLPPGSSAMSISHSHSMREHSLPPPHQLHNRSPVSEPLPIRAHPPMGKFPPPQAHPSLTHPMPAPIAPTPQGPYPPPARHPSLSPFSPSTHSHQYHRSPSQPLPPQPLPPQSRVFATPEPRPPGASGSPALANLLH
ncbi:putative PHD type zinc finger protein with BAH domain-containing protein [Orbilia ellipsospora]|uniref:PHD type zinc finger protein with BAH domain-containing protein n=1 Tax=Orbilia ellipsospora TaxID=2528407 RepID=A0AAV9WVP5_9PEZI